MNQKPGEKFPTTAEDLQGFWDMVMLQVHHVDSMFHMIEIMRANNWQVNTVFSYYFNCRHFFLGFINKPPHIKLCHCRK